MTAPRQLNVSSLPIHAPIGLVMALPEEARPVARAMRGARRERVIERSTAGVAAPGLFLQVTGTLGGQPVAVAWSGAGATGAARASRALLERGVGALLAVGFAGALSPALRPGDLVVAAEVVVPGAGRWCADAGLLSLAERIEPETERPAGPGLPRSVRPSPARVSQLHVGTLITTRRVVTTAAEKGRLREETGALAVDMESAAVAQEAARAGVPMLALRVITDGAGESLPLDFDLCFDSNGQFRHTRLIWLLARRPGALAGLLRLGRHSALAGRALVDLLAWYLPRVGGVIDGRGRD